MNDPMVLGNIEFSLSIDRHSCLFVNEKESTQGYNLVF